MTQIVFVSNLINFNKNSKNSRFINLMLKFNFFFSVLGLCKPTKSTEDLDYEDDPPFEEEDEEMEEEDDNPRDTEAPPQIISQKMNIHTTVGSTVILPCQVIHTGL